MCFVKESSEKWRHRFFTLQILKLLFDQMKKKEQQINLKNVIDPMFLVSTNVLINLELIN